jgi:hypothetical protein
VELNALTQDAARVPHDPQRHRQRRTERLAGEWALGHSARLRVGALRGPPQSLTSGTPIKAWRETSDSLILTQPPDNPRQRTPRRGTPERRLEDVWNCRPDPPGRRARKPAICTQLRADDNARGSVDLSVGEVPAWTAPTPGSVRRALTRTRRSVRSCRNSSLGVTSRVIAKTSQRIAAKARARL